jgi:uncharacterized SAM-dependent methyltransferase
MGTDVVSQILEATAKAIQAYNDYGDLQTLASANAFHEAMQELKRVTGI